MNKQNILNKLLSRKLWAAVVGVVVGLAAAFGIDGSEYTEIAGIVTSAVSVISYIFAEGAVDAAHAKGNAEGGGAEQ
ncbi:MAG: hypothetical protein IJC71_01720 [Clostridia bacterium]|nr:hypothetical protein [Clostridia bacterium]